MKELEELIEKETNNNAARRIKYALYLYKDLLTNENQELLDEYTRTLIDILKSDDNYTVNENRFKNDISNEFYNYLLKNDKTRYTAYNHVKRVERICNENNISIDDLYNGRSNYSISDLIGMYLSGGIKSEENIKKHYAPLCALKQLQDFMNRPKKPDVDFLDCGPFYLCDNEGYQSWEIKSKHPYIIEIEDKKCKITFKENGIISEEISKTINNANYNELINVFRKYKDILSKSSSSAMQSFPFVGAHSYSYQFENLSNNSGCAFLFESEDRKLVEQAYKEYHDILEKIIKQ